jgi:uncharacterized protein (TIGR02646 family)
VRKINKGVEPRTLTEYRASIPTKNLCDEHIYEDFKCKTREDCSNNVAGNLRKQLLEEQGYICCYCMERIGCSDCKIEHLKDQSGNRNLQINYRNLFVACSGNEGNQKNQQHCDTFKGNQDLDHIDLLSNIENSICYKDSDGEIFSKNSNINDEIDNILNLNLKRLKDNRKDAIKTFYQELKRELGTKDTWKTIDLNKKIQKYQKKDSSGKYKVYCEMFIYFLKKQVSRRTT